VFALATDDAKKRLFAAAIEVVASTPEQLTASMKADQLKFGRIIREVGIRVE
jgi:tripartite-type tricarboxylate transporter receptor subunit TctC